MPSLGVIPYEYVDELYVSKKTIVNGLPLLKTESFYVYLF